MGLFDMIAEHLTLPFETKVLGVEVMVDNLGQTERGDIVVTCRGRERQTLSVLDLPRPDPPPHGWKWIEA